MLVGRRNLFFVGVIALIIAFLLGAKAWYGSSGMDVIDKDEPVLPRRNYDGKRIYMEEIEVEISDEYIVFMLEKVDNNGLVSFEVAADGPSGKGSEYDFHIMSYIAPSGRIFVSESKCRSCEGEEYYIENNTLICDGCFVIYDLETRDIIDGPVASEGYLPEVLDFELERGQIKISLEQF